MPARFIYDERSSELFDASGAPLGVVSCQGSRQWNQLRRSPPADGEALCADCGRPFLNLAERSATARLKQAAPTQQPAWCLHAGPEAEVLTIQDPAALPAPLTLGRDPTRPFPIRTVWGPLNINRAAAMGYWPDVRLVKPAITRMRVQTGVAQRTTTGEVRLTRDAREWEMLQKAGGGTAWHTVSAPACHYPYLQRELLAAYAIPPLLPDGSPVLVRDPIEDVVGTAWSRGDVLRAVDVPATLEKRRLALHARDVKTAWIVGNEFPKSARACI